MQKTSLQDALLMVVVGSSVWFIWAVTNPPARAVEAATCVTPPSGLVGWWPGDGGATDIAGGYDGTLLGGTFFTTSNVGEGFTFDSDDDRVSIAHQPDYDVRSGSGNLNRGISGIAA